MFIDFHAILQHSLGQRPLLIASILPDDKYRGGLMNMRLFHIAGTMTVCAFLALPANAENWRGTGCSGVVEMELAKLQLSDLGKQSVSYIVSREGSAETDSSEALNGWVSFENCKGNLVIQLSKSCNIAQVYTLGDCRADGIHHY
tara:strand:+ start:2139 stop:2573 length:435 start_codon:yes stop_codon:yes gene_type:complete